jgi:hypothetical protein
VLPARYSRSLTGVKECLGFNVVDPDVVDSVADRDDVFGRHRCFGL